MKEVLYKFSLICGTREFARVSVPKCLILFVNGLFVSNGGFGLNHIWLNALVSVLVIMYCIYDIIKGYSEIKSKYFL